MNNLATVTFNRPGLVPFAVSGRELKSIHPFFNQRRAELQSLLPNGRHTTRRLERMESKRYRRVQDLFHKASHFIVKRLIRLQVGTLVIGKNDGWKQNDHIGKFNPNVFPNVAVRQTKGIAGYVVHPFRVNIPSLNSNKLNQAFGLIGP